MLIIDAHLDLAYNVRRGRDVTRPAAEQPVVHNEIATVGLPDLRAGGVGLVCATIFCSPKSREEDGYTTSEEARAQALWQLDVYRQWIAAGLLRFVTTPAELPDSGTGDPPVSAMVTPANISASEDPTLQHGRVAHATGQPAILLLEGADAIRTPDDVAEWFNAGLRIVGLAWKRTRYAGGTGEPGGLSPDGIALVQALDRFGILHDASHLAELAFWQLYDLTDSPIIATHSNCRAIVPTDRQLSDDMIRSIAKRGGVVGMNFYDKFLLPPPQHKARRATLADLLNHIRHVCDITGSANHVALGTDLDGGLGREQVPQEIVTIADLPKVADTMSAAGFSDDDVRNIMGGNWLRFFRQHLPA